MNFELQNAILLCKTCLNLLFGMCDIVLRLISAVQIKITKLCTFWLHAFVPLRPFILGDTQSCI